MDPGGGPGRILGLPVIDDTVRHFTREFTRALGQPPADYVEQVRVDAARRLLEAEPVLVTVAVTRCGFGSAETMRRAFRRRLGVPPDHYRRHFATNAYHADSTELPGGHHDHRQ